MIKLGENALAAKDFLATVTTEQKNKALLAIAAALRENSGTIILENKKDLENGKAAGLNDGRTALISKRFPCLSALSE